MITISKAPSLPPDLFSNLTTKQYILGLNGGPLTDTSPNSVYLCRAAEQSDHIKSLLLDHSNIPRAIFVYSTDNEADDRLLIQSVLPVLQVDQTAVFIAGKNALGETFEDVCNTVQSELGPGSFLPHDHFKVNLRNCHVLRGLSLQGLPDDADTDTLRAKNVVQHMHSIVTKTGGRFIMANITSYVMTARMSSLWPHCKIFVASATNITTPSRLLYGANRSWNEKDFQKTMTDLANYNVPIVLVNGAVTGFPISFSQLSDLTRFFRTLRPLNQADLEQAQNQTIFSFNQTATGVARMDAALMQEENTQAVASKLNRFMEEGASDLGIPVPCGQAAKYRVCDVQERLRDLSIGMILNDG